MRPGWATLPCGLLLLACLLPSVHGAGSDTVPAPPSGPLVDDPAGDVAVATTGQMAPTQAYAGIDLRALNVSEDETAFRFTVAVAGVKTGDQGESDDGAAVYIEFKHSGRAFQIGIYHFDYGPAGEAAQALLSYRDSDSASWSTIWFHQGGATADAAAGTYSVEIPRGDLADALGAAPFPGRSFTDVVVHSNNLASDGNFICCPFGQGVNAPVTFNDRMPDSGVAPNTYPIQRGLRQEGHAFLLSPEPFRASNGEATTFLFQAVGKNTGDAHDHFDLRATAVPKDWSVSLPEPSLDLEAGSEQLFPVLVTVPFNHVHGSVLSFVLEMASATDPGSIGRLQMGVRYLAIPQPAGHHDTLYFHSYAYGQLSGAIGNVFSGNEGYPFMNALEAMDGDAAKPLHPENVQTTTENNQPYETFSWCVALNPGLQMGLDFILNQKGHLSIPVHADAPLKGAYLVAQLQLMPPGSDTSPYSCFFFGGGNQPRILGRVNGTAPQDIGPNADGILEGDFQPAQAADKVPYAKGQNIALFVEVHALSVPNFFLGAATPSLIPGGQLTLPLLEYHDEVKDTITTALAPAVAMLGPQERHANPGSTIVFPLAIANSGADDRSYILNVTGTNAGWVQKSPPVTVPAHGTLNVQVIAQVPKDAKQGDSADLVVQVYNAQNSTARTLIRLLLVADTTATFPDDAAQVQKPDTTHKSPSVAPAALVAVLAVAALGLRRRTA